jgi:carboxyl-terminal processing protease
MQEQSGNPFRARLPVWAVVPMLLLTLLIGGGVGFITGLFVPRPAQQATTCPQTPEICTEFAVFWEVWELASDRYVDSEAVDPAAMTSGAVNGMLDSLGDQGHTRFLPADEAAAWDESLRGSFEGIGAYVDVRDGRPIIVAPIEGSPAEAAGLRPGDQVLAVDGESTDGWTIDRLISTVRGPRGTAVTLRVLHLGETTPVDVTITRASVDVPSVTWRVLSDATALVRISSFDDDTGTELEEALRAAQEAGARAIVLDLRNNPGGFLTEAVKSASQFLPSGSTILIETDRSGRQSPTVVRTPGVAQNIPVVVLVNENSASAAEILSGALQENNRAVIVGQPTFGTGTVLTPFRLDSGGRLLLGTSEWLTPEGRQIRGQGITPDEQVALPPAVAPLSPAEVAELSAEELALSDDAQLVRALELAAAVAGR